MKNLLFSQRKGLMPIRKIIPKENFLLHVVTQDKQESVFDVTPYLDSEVFAPLRKDNNFRQVHNGKYFIEWDCGADLSADTIEARWKKYSPTRIPNP